MRAQQGAALFTTLVMTVLTVMIVGAALLLLSGGSLMRGSVEAEQEALAAAQAGAEYARSRLQADPSWRGDANEVTVDQAGSLWIREDQGNVVGLLWGAQGPPSMFRLRFNHQNGASSPDDGLGGDPSAPMFVPSQYVSLNSLNSETSTPVYRANQAGGTFPVTDSTSTPFSIPRYSAALYVEGLAGDGMAGIDQGNLQEVSDRSGVTRRTVEVILSRELSQLGDSVLYGADEIDFNINNKLIISSEDDRVPPRIRTLQNVSLIGGSDPLEMDNGEVYVSPGYGSFTVNGIESTDPAATQKDSSANFLRLGWDQVDKADSSGASIPAGTYVWRDLPPRLDYYAVDYDPLNPPSGAPAATFLTGGDLDGGSGAVQLNPLTMRMTINRNVYVSPSGSAQGFAIVPEDGLLAATGLRPVSELIPLSPTDPAPILTAQGSVQVEGTFLGQGAVTSEGDIRFQGSSVFEADPDMKVAIYSKGDIVLEQVPLEVQSAYSGGGGGGGGGDDEDEGYDDEDGGGGGGDSPGPPDWLFGGGSSPFGSLSPGDVAFAGVLYAQGNFMATLDESLYLRGALVAYGGAPEDGQAPGENAGAGAVNVAASNAQLVYDSEYLLSLMDTTAPTRLEVRSWRKL